MELNRCPICFTDSNLLSVCPSRHGVCIDCISAYIENKKTVLLKCPFGDCDFIINNTSIETSLKSTLETDCDGVIEHIIKNSLINGIKSFYMMNIKTRIDDLSSLSTFDINHSENFKINFTDNDYLFILTRSKNTVKNSDLENKVSTITNLLLGCENKSVIMSILLLCSHKNIKMADIIKNNSFLNERTRASHIFKYIYNNVIFYFKNNKSKRVEKLFKALKNACFKISDVKCKSPGCNGFIINNICCVCDMSYCEKCKSIYKGSGHECNQNDLKNVEMIKTLVKESNYFGTCPKCKLIISKIESTCDIVDCPQCNTNFNLKTGQIFENKHTSRKDFRSGVEIFLKIINDDTDLSFMRSVISNYARDEYKIDINMKNSPFNVFTRLVSLGVFDDIGNFEKDTFESFVKYCFESCHKIFNMNKIIEIVRKKVFNVNITYADVGSLNTTMIEVPETYVKYTDKNGVEVKNPTFDQIKTLTSTTEVIKKNIELPPEKSSILSFKSYLMGNGNLTAKKNITKKIFDILYDYFVKYNCL